MSAGRGLTRAAVAELCGCKPSEIPHAPLYSLTSFTPPGPVCAAYIRSRGPIDAITGPGGSGKTVGSIFKVIRFSVAEMPVCIDNVVRVRGAVLRDNFRAMYRTTIRSWFAFFPPDFGGAHFTGGQDRPAQHILKFSTTRVIDGVVREVPVELTVDFFAVGDVAIEELLKGSEYSWIWANEADMLHERVVPFAYSRTGRYPERERLPPGTIRPRMVAVDFNPTPPKHPLWEACKRGSFQSGRDLDLGEMGGSGPPVSVDSLPETTLNFFQQPSGLSQQAENRLGKTFEEYQQDCRTMTENDVRRFVHGLPGYPTDGKPVYGREYRGSLHVAAGPLNVIPGLPLHAGVDQGQTPAILFFQEDSRGQIRIYQEVVPGHGTGIERFVEGIMPWMHSRFRGLPPGVYSGDPAGFFGADRQAGQLAWAEAVGYALGVQILPAPTNEPGLRWEAVKLALRMLDPDTPGLIIDPEGCPILIEGFEADYKYRKMPNGVYAKEADKSQMASNPHDALQYGLLGVRGRAGVIQAAARGNRPGNVHSITSRGPVTDFNVFS